MTHGPFKTAGKLSSYLVRVNLYPLKKTAGSKEISKK